MPCRLDPDLLASLHQGLAIPALPLALNSRRRLDERRQRALLRYYAAAGAGGVAAGVHTTQFAIRDPFHGLLHPVLSLAVEELRRADEKHDRRHLRIGGVCGQTKQAAAEAELLASLGFDAGLLSLAAMRDASEGELIAHCEAVAGIIPIVGFYLQPAVGGRVLPFSFWRRFAEIENVAAIKMAPFNRYQTLDVMRAVAESGRDDIALYTGNDDNIVLDLLTPYFFDVGGKTVERRIAGGLLGHWAVWTKGAVELLKRCREIVNRREPVSPMMLHRAVQVTDCNAAFFDVANGFAGCIAGIHEVLRRQGLLEGIWCLDPNEGLSRGQSEEIDRVWLAHAELSDDPFVIEHVDEWLR